MPLIPPTAKGILDTLPQDMPNMQVQVYPTIDSTNNQARRMIEHGDISSPTLLVSHAQSAGKGRLGRSFYSPAGSGLYMTLVYHATATPTHITPAAAVATADAIKAFSGQDVMIKWVNDLYLDGQKVCGILVERMPAPHGDGYLIMVGIGVNLTTHDFPQNLRHPAGCILSPQVAHQNTYDISTLASAIVTNFFAYLGNPDLCYTSYTSRFWLSGKQVTYAYVCTPDAPSQASPTVSGVVEGVTKEYELLLRLPSGEQLMLGSGEVTRVCEDT